jgi:hypothetical protein
MKIRYQRYIPSEHRQRTTSFSRKLSQLEHLRHFSKWLFVIPATMFILFSVGQLGILMSQQLAENNLTQVTSFDDGPWAYVLIHPSNSDNPDGVDLAIAPSGKQMDETSTLVVTNEPTVVLPTITEATQTQLLPSSTSPPTITPTRKSDTTHSPVVESSPSATESSETFTPTPSNKFCDADGNPLSYDDLHLHKANVEANSFGTVIHALQIDEEETQVELEKLTVIQNEGNARILELISVDWSHRGMGSTKIEVQKTQAEITIDPNLEFYACFVEGKCDHSLYGGEIYLNFDGELSGEYGLIMIVFFPEYDERCQLDLHINAEP